MLTNAQLPSFKKRGRTILPSSNPAKNDDIIARWIVDATKRYKSLKKAVNKTVVKNDAFGLRVQNVATAAPKGKFSRGRDDTRIKGFMTWLRANEKTTVLQRVKRPSRKAPQPWTDVYLRQNYTRGAVQANEQLRLLTEGTPIGLSATIPAFGESGKALTSFNQLPMSAARIGIAQTRTWEGMQGITAQMNAQIADTLAQGLLSGKGAIQIARDINGRIDAIGLTRAKLIARTEATQIYNEAALAEFDHVSGIIGEQILVQWQATLDDRVRATHLARHGKIFTSEQAQLLLGEPNCRCSVLPYIESIEGKAKLSKASTFINVAEFRSDYDRMEYWSRVKVGGCAGCAV
jgi:SPP1 gp7 family putative phage head morphogenesis protein